MSEQEQPVFHAALSLPPASRAELAELLWASLPDNSTDAGFSPHVREAWMDEAKRRMREIDEGKVELISGEEVMERLRQRMKT